MMEITAPLFMSRAVSNNVQYRMETTPAGTTLRFVHKAFGLIPEAAREGMPRGWSDQLDRVERRLT